MLKDSSLKSDEVGVSRADARARGLRFYMPDFTCKNGNLAPRYVNGGCRCQQCRHDAVQRTAAWQRDPKNAEALARNVARSRKKSNESGRRMAYYFANKTRELSNAAEWRRSNPEKVSEHRKRWAKANPEHVARMARERKEAEARARPAWFSRWDSFVMSEAADLVKRRTALTGIKWEQDHMIPLRGKKASGLHCAANIQVIPAALNYRKGNRLRLTERGEWIKHL